MRVDIILATETMEEAVEARQDFIEDCHKKGWYPVKRDGHITIPYLRMQIGIYPKYNLDMHALPEVEVVNTYEELWRITEAVA